MRTTRRLLRAALFIVAAGVTAVALAVSGEHTNARLDLTSSGQHKLGERTLARLRALDEPLELVLAVDRSRLDRRARDRVEDVLKTFDHAADRLRVTTIDTGSPDGPARYQALLGRLEAREAAARARRAEVESGIAERAEALAGRVLSLDVAARAAAETDPAGSTRLNEFAAFARVAGRQLRELLDTKPTDARAVADLAGDLAPRLGTIEDELRAAEPDAPTEETGLRLRNARRVAASLRGDAERVAQAAARLVPLDLERIEDALAGGEAALLVGPPRPPSEGSSPGVVAIDPRELLPSPEYYRLAGLAGEIETAANAERLVASAITVLTDPARPIVVFIHGQPGRGIARAREIRALITRLGRSGIGVAEWAPLVDEGPPDLAALDPDGVRPVVYVIISPDSAAPSRPNDPRSIPGTERARIVGGVVSDLLARGEPVLVNLNPSVFPTFGDDDPVAAALAPLGVGAASATPVLRTVAGPAGPVPATAHRLIPRGGGHAIARAIEGLPITLEWPVPITLRAESGDAVLTLDSNDAWAESQWLRFWRTPGAQRGLLDDAPELDDDDRRGPWVVAAALRGGAGPEGPGPRARAVVVGSNTWFFDDAWQSRQLIGGRPVMQSPGNVELFDAAVLWLAGRDELIAASPEARPVPLVRPVSEGLLLTTRWALIGGLPLGVLLLGGLVHLIRR